MSRSGLGSFILAQIWPADFPRLSTDRHDRRFLYVKRHKFGGFEDLLFVKVRTFPPSHFRQVVWIEADGWHARCDIAVSPDKVLFNTTFEFRSQADTGGVTRSTLPAVHGIDGRRRWLVESFMSGISRS